MYTVTALNHFVQNNQLWAYVLIFFLTIIEGEVVGISSGILILLGALNFWVALIALFCGGMVKTFLGYYIGVFLHKHFKHNKFFQYIEKKVFTVMPHFNKRPFWSIFISKFIIGVNHMVIIFSGYQRINFKSYLKAEFFSTILWAPLLLLLGYFFSYTALHVSRQISEFFLIVVLLTVAFFALGKLMSLLYDVFENI